MTRRRAVDMISGAQSCKNYNVDRLGFLTLCRSEYNCPSPRFC